ncbi:uncharacterized protein LOC111018022 [Momordica charantia]|uniref:Uncharacterized protein LOC111018022 n=1 Tax=Momordica charantia TaxID=3673 RepID=A0A6J1D6A0_MOMCH|nr:uncharacterized protein LOC111018022 [Momordica charantia]
MDHGGKSKISLEDYLDFFSSNNQLLLTVNYLTQIIKMHGYRKINAQKSVLREAVSAIDLINPSRSTLEESVSSSASIPLEDVISDLKDLDWLECCATSVVTFSSRSQNSSSPSPDHQEPTCASKKPERKLRRLVERLDQTEAANDGVSSSCASKDLERKLGPQSKRKKTAA